MALSDAEQQVIDGTAWDEFCDALKEAGKVIRSEKAPKDSFNQAEGYRYLARLLRGGLESFLSFVILCFRSCAAGLTRPSS